MQMWHQTQMYLANKLYRLVVGSDNSAEECPTTSTSNHALDGDTVDVVDAELKSRFDSASAHVATVAGNLDQNVLLQLYGRYKVATCGLCSTPKPSIFEPSARRKWESWSYLKDLTAKEAMQEYCQLVQKLYCGWNPSAAVKTRPTGFGLKVSQFAIGDDNDDSSEMDSSLLAAVKANDLIAIRRQLHTLSVDECKKRLEETDPSGLTPLHWAADRGHTAVCRLLLSMGADVQATDADGQTPLHYAVACDHADVVRLLVVDHGADRTQPDADGVRPTDVCESEAVRRLLMDE